MFSRNNIITGAMSAFQLCMDVKVKVKEILICVCVTSMPFDSFVLLNGKVHKGGKPASDTGCMRLYFASFLL